MDELQLIYCNQCEMPIELCECKDGKIVYDWNDDIFVLIGEDDE